MKLSQAINHFASVSLEGWDGSSWVPNIARGDLQTFDRFISERSFGQKKRTFLTSPANAIPAIYETIRTPDGVIYIVLSDNNDIRSNEVYGITYFLVRADFSLSFRTMQAPLLASGMRGGASVPTITSVVWGDMERITSVNSREFDNIKYSSFVITVPSTIAVTLDHEVVHNSEIFEIKEINTVLKSLEIRAIRR